MNFTDEQLAQLEGVIEKVIRRVNKQVREDNATWVTAKVAMEMLNIKSYDTFKKLITAGIINANNSGSGQKIEYLKSDIIKYKANRRAYAELLK